MSIFFGAPGLSCAKFTYNKHKPFLHTRRHNRESSPEVQMEKDKIIVITVSGRGDKDCAAIARYRGEDIHE